MISRRQSLRLADAVPHIVGFGGVLVGGVLAVTHLLVPELLPLSWLEVEDWPLTAFGAFGAMSGFALASLALVASLAGHPRARDVVDSNAGRRLLQSLLWSMWAWLVPAIVALLTLVSSTPVLEAAFLFGVALGTARALVALHAMTHFFTRFTMKKPETVEAADVHPIDDRRRGR